VDLEETQERIGWVLHQLEFGMKRSKDGCYE
jgi:hypothetical protein